MAAPFFAALLKAKAFSDSFGGRNPLSDVEFDSDQTDVSGDLSGSFATINRGQEDQGLLSSLSTLKTDQKDPETQNALARIARLLGGMS